MGYLGIDFELLYVFNWNSLLNLIKGSEKRISDERREAWDRMRILASILISPHVKKGKKVTPEQLIPMSWDKVKEEIEFSEVANEKATDDFVKMLEGM